MKKRFITNLALLIILNLLIKPFWFFGIEVGVQNRVGEEMYGFYFSLFNFSFILNIILDLGINNFNNRAISMNNTLLRDYLSSIIPLKILLFLVYVTVVFVSGKLLHYSSAQFSMIWILVLNQFIASFILYLRTNISGLQYYRTDSLLSVLDRSLMILFTGLLLWGNLTDKPFRIEWFVLAQTASYTLTFIVCLTIVLSKSGTVPLRFHIRDSLNILRMSYPFALLILLMSMFNRIDSVMLERMLPDGKVEAGIYAQSFRILDASSQFSFLFAMLLLPMFSRMLKERNPVNDLIRLAFPILLVSGITLALIAHFYNQEIISVLYKHHAPYSSRIFQILMIGFIFISTSYIYGTLLTAHGNLRHLNLLAAVTVILNVILNFILIPSHQALGAAIASISSQGFYALLQMIVAGKLVRVPLNRDILLKSLLFAAINLVAGYLLLNVPGWIPGLFLLLLSCLLSSLLLRLIRPLELWSIIRTDEP